MNLTYIGALALENGDEIINFLLTSLILQCHNK
jgi:hypothetical protein